MVESTSVTLYGTGYRFGSLTSRQVWDLIHEKSNDPDFGLLVIASALNNIDPNGEPYDAKRVRVEISEQVSYELAAAVFKFSRVPGAELLLQLISAGRALALAGKNASEYKN